MRVMLAGDTHGDIQHCSWLVQRAKMLELDYIVQLGDFGYWPHYGQGRRFLEALHKMLDKAGVTLLWLDGNHENHTLLRETYRGLDDGQLWSTSDRIHHMPRSFTWEWDGCRFMALGGAYSIDMDQRVAGESWWPEETLDNADVEKAVETITAWRPHVMLTHDAPEGVPCIPEHGTWDRQKDNWPASVENRRRLREVVDAAPPQLLVHGHYHHRYEAWLNQPAGLTHVVGLGCNGMLGDSFTVIDTADIVSGEG